MPADTSSPSAAIEIRPITAEQTHALRRTELRNGTVSDAVVFDVDADPDTFHIGALRADRVVGISTWTPVVSEYRSNQRGYRLRGMATSPDGRGAGVGSLILQAGLTRCRLNGAEFALANARVSALGFYLRHGFTTVSEQYIDMSTTGLPHQFVVLDLAA